MSSKMIEPEPLRDIKILMFSKPALSETRQRCCVNGNSNLSFAALLPICPTRLLFLLPGDPPPFVISHTALQDVGSWDSLRGPMSVRGAAVGDDLMSSLSSCREEEGNGCLLRLR